MRNLWGYIQNSESIELLRCGTVQLEITEIPFIDGATERFKLLNTLLCTPSRIQKA